MNNSQGVWSQKACWEMRAVCAGPGPIRPPELWTKLECDPVGTVSQGAGT